ncbi:MAG: hypothetical protein KAT34_04730 [Candidatus Aminicenantes bacterium]|nr:hypothetical protein [Candidatus Aminicenantes bacterium]
MNNRLLLIKSWIKLGIISGLLASVIYPVLIFINLPKVFQVVLAMAWGPLLGISAVGGYYFFNLHRETISLKIATISQIIAGVLVTIMLLVQMAIFSAKPEVLGESNRWIWDSINQVQLGLDVAWDVFLFLSIFLFSINMFNHPEFGKIFSIIGVIISVLLIAFNIASFPIPPGEAGSIDFGPLAGLFGLAMTVNILLRLKWVSKKILITGDTYSSSETGKKGRSLEMCKF